MDGKGVKNGGPDGHLCFHCGQLGNLKKDWPLGLYCSRCDTRGHTPAKCPNKKGQQQNEMHKSGNQQPEKRCKNWKRAQDQPQYLNPENKCLHCAGNHRSCDCPTRHQHQVPPATNPVGSTGTHSPHYFPRFSNPSPQQHSQQSQSTVGASTPTLMVNTPQQFQQGPQRQVTPPAQQQVNQQVRPQPVNPQYNQFNIQQQSQVFAPQQFSAQYSPPYLGQWPQQPPSVHSNTTETSEVLTQVLDRHFKLYEDRENACEQCKREKESERRSTEMKQMTGTGSTRHLRRFDGSNPDQCLPCMEEIFAMARTHKRNARNELIYNSGGSVQKTLYSLPSGALEDKICDLLLRNHSNLKTSSQRISAFDSLQQKPEEPLQTYNARYQSYYELAHEGLTITSNGSKVSCIHYSKSLHGKLSEELEGRFSQRLPDNLQDAFDRAMDFEPRILTSQCIHTRNVNEINHIEVSSSYQEFEVNEAHHIHNPNYKGKNYDPNYQKNKINQNNSSNSTYNKNNNSNNGSNNSTTSRNFRSKGDYIEIPSNVEVTLKGPVNQDQLTKIKEILKNPQIYKDKVQKNQYPASGEYAKSFSKFCPKKVEVNKATVDDVICYGMHLKKSELEMAEAINIYKALGDNTYYGPEEQPADPPQQEDQSLPTRYQPDAYLSTVQSSAPREIDCFTIALEKKTGTTFPVNINNQIVNALYDTGAGCSLINYSMYETLGRNFEKGYMPLVKSSTREDMGALGQVTYTFQINGISFTQRFIVCRNMS